MRKQALSSLSSSETASLIGVLYVAVFSAPKQIIDFTRARDDEAIIETGLAYGCNKMCSLDLGAFVTVKADIANLAFCKRHKFNALTIECPVTVRVDSADFYACTLGYVKSYFADLDSLKIALRNDEDQWDWSWQDLLNLLHDRPDYRSRSLFAVFNDNQVLQLVDDKRLKTLISESNQHLFKSFNDEVRSFGLNLNCNRTGLVA